MNDELNKDVPQKTDGWGLRKKRLTALNLIVMILVLLAIVSGVNYLASQYYKRIDCTSSRIYALSDKTRTVLKDLKEPLIIYTLFLTQHEVVPKLKDLLDEYKTYSSKIVIEELSEANPQLTQQKLKFLAEEYKIDLSGIGLEAMQGSNTPGCMIFIYGNKNKVVNLKDSYTPKYSGGWTAQETGIETFRGEEMMTGAILSVIQGKQTAIYFTKGHGEPALDKLDGSGIVYVNDLLKRENIVTAQIDLMKTEKTPADCDVLIMAGPAKPIKPHEIRLLNDYLSSGGKMMVLVDPDTETNLEIFLKEWGVLIDDNAVLDMENCIRLAKQVSGTDRVITSKDITVPIITDYGARQHPITQKMNEQISTYFILSRSLEPVRPAPTDLEIVEIARSSPQSWGERNLKSALADKKVPEFNKDSEKKGPLVLGLAVTKKLKSESPNQSETRLVVFGDSDMIRDAYLNPASDGYLGVNDLFLNSVRWLARQEQMISIEPKKPEDTKIDLNTGQRLLVLMLLSLVFLPLFSIVFGIVVWLIRRK